MVDKVSTYEEPQGAPQGHDEAMVAKVDEVEKFLNDRQEPKEVENASDDPPQKIAGKFDSVEDLEKAYKELERKLGKAPDEPKAEEKTADEKAQDAVESAGLNMEEMSDYYASNGELSDDHYSALEKAGIPRAYVDAYVEAIQSKAESAQSAIVDQVGGPEQYSEMTEWAKQNLEPREIERFNRAIDSGDSDIIENAVMGLAYRYSKEVSTAPKLLGGEGKGGGSVFESVAQLTAAMGDPRYKSDPAYRKTVEQKLQRSNIL